MQSFCRLNKFSPHAKGANSQGKGWLCNNVYCQQQKPISYALRNVLSPALFYKFQTRWRRKIYILIKDRGNVTVMVYQNNNYHMGKAVPWVTLVSFALYLLSYFYYFLCFPWRNVHFIFTDIFKSGGEF